MSQMFNFQHAVDVGSAPVCEQCKEINDYILMCMFRASFPISLSRDQS